MADPIVCILVATVVICILLLVFEFYPRHYMFVDSLLNAHEYNRSEFGIDSAAKCRSQCKADARCKATEFIFDYGGSGSNACVFYDSFTGTLGSTHAPSDQTTGVWVKQGP